LFLVRQGTLRGWGSVGYAREAAARQRAFAAPADGGRAGRLAECSEPGLEIETEAADPDFGQPRPAESAAGLVRIKGQAIAMLLVERSERELPWSPPILGVALEFARLRLQLDLALRRVQGPGAAPGDEARPEPASAAPLPVSTSVTVEMSTDLAPASEPTAADAPEIVAARRFAKLVATDIRLYNEEAVIEGRKHGDLPRRLGDHLGRGKETFLRRHGDLGPTGLDILHDAYVQVLAGGDSALIPASVLK
jgi:hypothetical protein